MRRFFGMIGVILIFLMMTACGGQTAPDTDGREAPVQTPLAAAAEVGPLRLCDPLRGGGAPARDGWYFTQIRPDGNLNIRYLDAATHTELTLCSRPNCTHSDDSCGSFVHSNGLTPSLAVAGDRLLLINGGINLSQPGKEDLAYIDRMGLDGEGRTRIYQADAASELGAPITDEQALYMVETTLQQTDGTPTPAQHLIRIDLETGEKTALADLGQGTIYLCDVQDTVLYYYSIAPKEGAGSLADAVVDYYRYDLAQGQPEKIASNEPSLQKAMTVIDETLYTIDGVSGQLGMLDVTQEDAQEITIPLQLEVPLSGLSIRTLIDGKLILDAMRAETAETAETNGTLESVCYAIDLESKDVQEWPLFYQSEAAPEPTPVRIAAELPDVFLVECQTDMITVDYGESGAYRMSIPQYATITKQDFWNGIPNYTRFSALGA